MPLKNTACTIQQRISKKTVLSMLNSPKVKGPQVGEQVQYTNNIGITKQYRVSRVNRDTVILETNTEIIEVNKNEIIQKNTIFLDKLKEDEWNITSFDPKTRIVCIEVITDNGRRPISVTLPELSY